MSRSAQVYNIVKSLSRGEKRQFKLNTFKYEKRHKHISSMLFDILDRMNSWDDNVFKQKLKEAGISKGAAVHINTLLNQLLDSLRTNEATSNPVFKINKLVEEALLLKKRDEFSLAMKRIRKALAIAESAEIHEKQVEIMMLQRSLKQHMMTKREYTEFRKAHYSHLKDTLDKLENKVDYFNLMEETFQTVFTIGYPESESERSKYKEVMSDPMLKDIGNARSSGAAISFLFIHLLYHQSMHDLEKARDVALQQVEIFDSNTSFAKAEIQTYISVVNNLATMQAHTDSFETFAETIQKLRSIPERFDLDDKYIEQRIFEYSYSIELDYYISRDKLEEFAEVIPVVERKILYYMSNGALFSRFVNLSLHLALYYFRTREYKKSHDWVKKVLEEKETLSTIYINIYAMIVDLLLHFRMGDDRYLRYRITAVRKYFKKHEQLLPINAELFNALRQLMRVNDMEKTEKINQDFRASFEQIPNSMTKLFYEKYLSIYDLIERKFWMEERLKGN